MFCLLKIAAPLTPLASPCIGFRNDVLSFISFKLLKFVKYISVISLILSNESISFDKPPPNTIASGSSKLMINERLRLKLFLNSLIISISFGRLDLAFLKISFAVSFFLNFEKNCLSNPLPEIYSSILFLLSGLPSGICPHSPVNELVLRVFFY